MREESEELQGSSGATAKNLTSKTLKSIKEEGKWIEVVSFEVLALKITRETICLGFPFSFVISFECVCEFKFGRSFRSYILI